jgi:Carboxypeptidase regulatory-like domain
LTIAHRSRGAAVVASLLFGTSVHAGERDGGLMGWVESTRGAPVAGAVVSVFGKGIRGGSLVTVADSAGQFALPALPAGSYTVRALGTGHEPAAARKVTVVPERDSVFTVSLTPIGEIAAPAAKADAPAAEVETLTVREWQWLLRHRRRSVLEAGEEEAVLKEPPPAAVALAARGAWVPELAGSVELVTSPSALGLDADVLGTASTQASQGAVRLQGRLADAGRWSLGGLVTEAENRTWRMGAEFVLEPGGSHQIQTGAGYGTNYLRNPTSASADALVQHSVGAAFVKDRFALGRSTWGTVGARYAYLGFLNDPNHVDATLGLEYREDEYAWIRASVSSRTLAPGGDLLTLSTLKTSPVITYATLQEGLRPSRTWRYELSADRALGPAKVGAHIFYEDTADQLVNVFDQAAARTLRVLNGGHIDTRGIGLTVGGHLGEVVNGSLTYSYGRTTRDGGPRNAAVVADAWGIVGYEEADYHDLVARVETYIDWSDTRVAAYYRFNTVNPEADGRGGHSTCTNTRFDVQLSQGLPFLQTLTRADWEVLVAVRNLFYEAAEGAALDELVVLHPPKRVMGGISVRF